MKVLIWRFGIFSCTWNRKQFNFLSSDVRKSKCVQPSFTRCITLHSIYAFLQLFVANGILIALPPERGREINSGCVNVSGCAEYFCHDWLWLLPIDRRSQSERKLNPLICHQNLHWIVLRPFQCLCFCEREISVCWHNLALQCIMNSQLGGDCLVNLTRWELSLEFCLEGSDGTGAALLFTEHCGGHSDSSHHSGKFLPLSAVSPSSAPLTLSWPRHWIITVKKQSDVCNKLLGRAVRWSADVWTSVN